MNPNAYTYTTPFQRTKSLRRGIDPAIDLTNSEPRVAGKTICIKHQNIARCLGSSGSKRRRSGWLNKSLLREPTEAIKSVFHTRSSRRRDSRHHGLVEGRVSVQEGGVHNDKGGAIVNPALSPRPRASSTWSSTMNAVRP